MTNLTQTQVNINRAREEALAAESPGGLYYMPVNTYKEFKEIFSVTIPQKS